MIARLLISADLASRKEVINQILNDYKMPNPHPDLLYFLSDAKLGIEQSRKIKEHFSLKPYSAKGRIAVLENAGELTREAQNALLKTIEELPENAVFILASDSDSKFLPTILSRCEVTRVKGKRSLRSDDLKESRVEDAAQVQEIEKLLNSTIEERFEFVEKLKDKEGFLQALVAYFHKKLPDNSEYVSELMQAEAWARQNVNIRAILEYLMLEMPTVK